MWKIVMELDVVSDDAMSADDVAEMLGVLIDDLDSTTLEPAVDASGTGHMVRVEMEAFLPDAVDEQDALVKGEAAMRAALHAAELRPEGARNALTQDTRVLQEA